MKPSEAGRERVLRRIDYETTIGGDTTMQDAAMPPKRRSESHHDREPILASTHAEATPALDRTTQTTRPSPPATPPLQRRRERIESGRHPKCGRGPSAASVMAPHLNPTTPVADRSDRHRQPTLRAASHARSDPHRSVADCLNRNRRPAQSPQRNQDRAATFGSSSTPTPGPAFTSGAQPTHAVRAPCVLYIRGTLGRGPGCEHFVSGPDEVDLNVIGSAGKG